MGQAVCQYPKDNADADSTFDNTLDFIDCYKGRTKRKNFDT